ncbi:MULTISPECIES: UvrD-helicase domain-containing protein [unclassified Prochlorococcus]|uniref:UvrD-helicase domain-containing protein n=1 Tax=unclassified Prochlorococcus TaxID=2627481 RepID=UPI0005338E20|nr:MULTISPECIES: UvrD-helicase domain-containing protein [unclassified Prochlorococcus]KGG15417.1 Exodeoxyribonuclease V beta chain [Prochlorococcus sp. MIT 0602]KGG17695.1 Exodeoxyribonuclease V beta chain [Prochlorococcus sp. MIT 0603]
MNTKKFTFKPNHYPLEPGMRLLEASAGTGKTFSLSHLVLRLLTEKEYSMEEILVISFTKATASEIQAKISSRLLLALKGLENIKTNSKVGTLDQVLIEWLELNAKKKSTRLRLAGQILKALESIDHADITTIHGFCRRTLRRESIAIGCDIDPEQISEEDNERLMHEIIHEYWKEHILGINPLHYKGLQMAGLSLDNLFSSLSKIDNDPSVDFIVDDPKINSSTELSDQFEGWFKECWEKFIFHWNKGGVDLEKYIRNQSLIWKEMGVANIKPFSPKPRRDRVLEITDWILKYTIFKNNQETKLTPSYYVVRSNLLLKDYFHPGKISEIEARNDLKQSISPYSTLQCAIAELWDKPAEMTWKHALSWCNHKLKERRSNSGIISYSDQLKALDPGANQLNDITKNQITKKLQERYKVILIDEFQDTDPVQWRIISEAFSKSNNHVLILVGDPKQSIYRFRGSDLSTYLNARKNVDRIDSLLTNYRAIPELVSGLNTLMKCGLKNSSLEVPTLSSATKAKEHTATPIEILNFDVTSSTTNNSGEELPSKSLVEESIPSIVTTTILRLLKNEALTTNLDDICVLVNRHDQAEKIRDNLAKANLPSRLINQGDVLESLASECLQIFLDCLAYPTKIANIKRLAASPLLQWGLTKIQSSDENGDIDQLVIKCKDWAQGLQTKGLPNCLSELLEGENIANLSERGRLLGDLQQCAEIVQEQIHIEGLDAHLTARWLRQQCNRDLKHIPELRRPNSDIAESAITIITVHRSKGLQYKTVICPYLWQAPPIPKGPIWRIKGSETWYFSLNTDGDKMKTILENSINESIEESERIAYVALTRAQNKLIVIWSMATNQAKNPLRYLFFGKEEENYNQKELSIKTMQKWIKDQDKNITIKNIEINKTNDFWSSTNSSEQLSIGPTPERALDQSWGRYSYSKWISSATDKYAYPQSPRISEEGKDTEQIELRAKDVDSNQFVSQLVDVKYSQSPLAEFPRGPVAGDCLHRILEKLDFSLPITDPKTASLIEDELRKSSISIDMKSNVKDALKRVLSVPLGGALGNLQLKQLNSNRCISELKFDLSLSINDNAIKSIDIYKAFRKNPDSKFGKIYPKKLIDLNISSKGFFTGSIDLIFYDKDNFKEARWWLIDWKSNWIGNDMEDSKSINCSPDNYSQKNMYKQMIEHHYPLQAHLYLVALHRYLNWRLVDYNPSKHLGGYVYIFLRGIPKTKEISSYNLKSKVPGIFLEEAPIERILALDKLMDGTK